jgi:hypothetical protein
MTRPEATGNDFQNPKVLAREENSFVLGSCVKKVMKPKQDQDRLETCPTPGS